MKQKDWGTMIAQGNYVQTTYFTTGILEISIGCNEMAEDETAVYYQDGLYKVVVNGELKKAATQVLLHVFDK